MKWEQVDNKIVAQGKLGKFVITKSNNFYKAEYFGVKKYFVFPLKRSIKKIKEICEINLYWEY